MIKGKQNMDWYAFNENEKKKDYYVQLSHFIDKEYDEKICYPERDKILNALNLTPYEQTKVVILGQDPYHGEGQAMGLSFAVPDGIKLPPSLRNIYKELQIEFGYQIPESGDLTPWALQGVLLLNSVLTVRAHEPTSHAGKGWETYTDRILQELNKKMTPVVFILWGKYAREKKNLITGRQHLVLEAPHPSPYSASGGFFGCCHFEKCNEFLQANNMSQINWKIGG